MVRRLCLPLLLILMCNYVAAQSSDVRTLSGVIVTQQA